MLRIELGPALISHTQLELLRMMLKEFCLGYKREQLTLCPMDPEHAAIVFFTQRREESSRALVESLHEMLLERGAPVPLIAVSMHPGPLSARYARAVTQLNRWDARPGAAIWMPEDAPQKSDRMWYPIKVEERLIQQIKSGDASAVRQSLERISVQNFQERNLGPVMQRSLVRAFEHTMERVLEESQIHAPSTALRRESPMEDFESWCLSMAGETERLRQLSGARQMEPVYAYLKENYSDNQLSLGGMARHFGFSETYFSRMFKTQAGINYSEYVERLRIEKAREMLCSHHTVDEIAGAVGYNSVSVFRSAFKRVTGETPSAYKAHISS